jgi:hypothetical protein
VRADELGRFLEKLDELGRREETREDANHGVASLLSLVALRELDADRRADRVGDLLADRRRRGRGAGNLAAGPRRVFARLLECFECPNEPGQLAGELRHALRLLGELEHDVGLSARRPLVQIDKAIDDAFGLLKAPAEVGDAPHVLVGDALALRDAALDIGEPAIEGRPRLRYLGAERLPNGVELGERRRPFVVVGRRGNPEGRGRSSRHRGTSSGPEGAGRGHGRARLYAPGERPQAP